MTGLRIARMGSFYVGGRQVRVSSQPKRRIDFTRTVSFDYDPNGLFHVEQAYVQYFVPEEPISELPIVLLHGGGFTGTMWETTPDGRPGWVDCFLRMGFPVYVVDNVERGRAGWCSLPGVWEGDPIVRSAEECWSLFRFGLAEDFERRRAFAGQRFPIDCLEVLINGCVPRWLGNNDVAVDTFAAVLHEIGPCCVIAHSHGAEIAFRAVARRPKRTISMVAIEPSGFPEDPASIEPRSVLVVTGDFMEATPLWQALSARTEAVVSELCRSGRDARHWSLPGLGISGNSHMMMMDDNNAELARLIGDWIVEQDGNRPAAGIPGM